MISDSSMNPKRQGKYILQVVLGLIAVGLIDYFTGHEIRVFPLYFFPLSIAAWQFGQRGALLTTFTGVLVWLAANRFAGLEYSKNYIWLINAFAQVAAFTTVSLLLAWAKSLVDSERALSRTDSLTGLANPRAFQEMTAIAVSNCRRHQRPLVLAYIDLDNFKCVNDKFGHSSGDKLLCDTAGVLRKSLRQTDIIARMGGDEFILCLPETSFEQAQELLQRLHKSLADALPKDQCAVSSSIGAVSWAIPPDNIDAMITSADKLMYEIKHGGKNRLEVFKMPLPNEGAAI